MLYLRRVVADDNSRVSGVLHSLARAISSQPAAYQLIQRIAGHRRVSRALEMTMREAAVSGPILDVGSSIGSADHLGSAVRVDIDIVPLLVTKQRNRRARAVVCDASALPFRRLAFSAAVMVAVSHHLAPEVWRRSLDEAARVTGEWFFFVDAVRNDRRTLSRVLWRYDRGAHPRSEADILAGLSSRFEIVQVARLAPLHEFVLVACRSVPREGSE